MQKPITPILPVVRPESSSQARAVARSVNARPSPGGERAHGGDEAPARPAVAEQVNGQRQVPCRRQPVRMADRDAVEAESFVDHQDRRKRPLALRRRQVAAQHGRTAGCGAGLAQVNVAEIVDRLPAGGPAMACTCPCHAGPPCRLLRLILAGRTRRRNRAPKPAPHPGSKKRRQTSPKESPTPPACEWLVFLEGVLDVFADLLRVGHNLVLLALRPEAGRCPWRFQQLPWPCRRGSLLRSESCLRYPWCVPPFVSG